MADLTDLAKDKALSIMFANTSVGLIRDHKEITDEGYERQEFSAADPDGEQHGARTVRNAAPIVWGPWGEDAPDVVDGWFVAGADGVVASGEFAAARKPLRGDEVVMHEGELIVGLR